MNKSVLSLTLLGSLIVSIGAAAAPATRVTNGGNDGPGSLRAALANGATQIVIRPRVTVITVIETLEYTGVAPLSIKGTGQTIDGSALPDLASILHLTNGADLSMSNLVVQGAGGFSIENPGGGKGIFIEVPDDREGLVSVTLNRVVVLDTGNHGVHVSDCSLGDECGGGQGGGGDGSPASISVRLNHVTIGGVGFGKQDADGLRVDDRGEGSIYLDVTNSTFVNVGGDGIELDEGNEGGVSINVRNSTFDSNGAYCSDEFVDDPITLDPACDDDGDPDVDDAFDIDEAGPGGITGLVRNIELFDNFDEGLDFDAEGEGAGNLVDLVMVNVVASGNADEAIKVSEEGNASVVVKLSAIEVEGDVEVEEEDTGDLRVSVSGSSIGDNLKLSQDGDGEGTVKLRGTSIGNELDLSGVEEI